MKYISLRQSLGDPQADATAQEVIRVYEQSFPDQIAAYYIEGSYADQTALPTSDIDMVIVFRDRFADAAIREAAAQTWVNKQESTLEVDISIVEEASLQSGVTPGLKQGSLLIYGEDVCSHYPLVSIEEWARERMNAAYWLTINVYERPKPVQLPLAYPAPDDEFYGYTKRTITLADGHEVPCTRNLVRTTGWAATALLAHQAGQFVSRKRDNVRLYREYIGDEWTTLLEEIAQFCRDEWQYLIPEQPRARDRLRAICARTLNFEQHFLQVYKPYLLAQLNSPVQEHVQFARWLQQNTPLISDLR